ncbi:DUF421 domain-containing protein [Bacillus sp. 03113]|uniref:DUF421 domain-containing protein n=1 Tax=Bacillus sp. 03113 TaxID=2578211 RepID=UPI001144812A|nr:DUF421 domain-containing protein [Bacillus sp. 03113]
MEFVHILSEIIVGYIALFILTKWLGKTQINQFTPFDFISALVLGELVGNALFDEKTGLSHILFSVVIWGILIFTTEIITQKSIRFRKVLEGEPSIIIRKGKIDFNVMKKNHLDLNQLQYLLRSKDVFSIRECEYALLETDGTISVLKKAEYTYPVLHDLNLPIKPITLPVPLILDGEIIDKNLTLVNWDQNKIEQEVKAHGISSTKKVFYAEWKEGEALHLQTYD